jgi:hypothetical protein
MDWNITFEMAALSHAAYDDDSEAIREWYEHSLFVKHPRTGTEAYAVAGNGYRAVAVRGSDAVIDWLWNFYLCRRRDGIHKGLAEAADDLLEDKSLLKFLSEHEREGPILLTGHSRGGSISQILALEFSGVSAVFCFGSSRAGCSTFRRNYNKLNIPTYLFRNRFDHITCLPPWWWGYVHVNKQLKLDARGHDMVSYLDAVAKKAGYE